MIKLNELVAKVKRKKLILSATLTGLLFSLNGKLSTVMAKSEFDFLKGEGSGVFDDVQKEIQGAGISLIQLVRVVSIIGIVVFGSILGLKFFSSNVNKVEQAKSSLGNFAAGIFIIFGIVFFATLIADIASKFGA